MNTSKSLTIITPNHPALQPSANPVAVYLASLGTGSRRAMRQALRVFAELLTGTETDPASLPWWNMGYQHTQAIRSLLMERVQSGFHKQDAGGLAGCAAGILAAGIHGCRDVSPGHRH